ncbi:hypothetical protein BDF21DRAFT_397727 [Thamnidium elegans]|nr:hypothetical protein BDF21DRAFT_397727 [Thamnidium elegans]
MAIQPRDAFSSLAIGLSGLCNLILALIPDSVNPTLNFKLLPLPSLMKEQDWTAMRKLSIHTSKSTCPLISMESLTFSFIVFEVSVTTAIKDLVETGDDEYIEACREDLVSFQE